jgi:hypothetical protein
MIKLNECGTQVLEWQMPLALMLPANGLPLSRRERK